MKLKKFFREHKTITRNYPSPRISSEVPDCSLPMTFDQYGGCSYGCRYCFAHVFKELNPTYRRSEKPFELGAVPPDVICALMKGKGNYQGKKSFRKYFFRHKFILHWGGLADPFCHFEKQYRVGEKIIEAAAESNYPILFSTKGDLRKFDNCLSIFKKSAKQGNFAFQISMVTAKEELAKIVEKGAPTPTERLKSMEKLASMGYYVILRFRPFILGISDVDKNYMDLIRQAKDAGARAISTEFYCANFQEDQEGGSTWHGDLAKILQQYGGVKNTFEYYNKLSPTKRGTYKRLNRLVKERFVRNMYEFCLKNKMLFAVSDPDFKEVGMTLSCCGLPDKELAERFGWKINPGLFNWSRNQLTAALITARRQFWRGEKVQIEFDSIFPLRSTVPHLPFINESTFVSSLPQTIGTKSVFRRGYTIRDILINKWNGQYPYKYFDGKLKPEYVKDGNLVYTYVPSDYEYRWQEDGINLSDL
jgi:DNA repair photolyase